MLTVVGIKSRLQDAFGSVQDPMIQGVELDKLATALYKSLTIYPILSPLLATPGTAQGSLFVVPGTFLTALQAEYPVAEGVSIQTNEFTKLANGIEEIINSDAIANYPLLQGVTPFVTNILSGSITSAQVLFELQDAFGEVQDMDIQSLSLTPLSKAIATGLNSCTVSINLTVGGADILAPGNII